MTGRVTLEEIDQQRAAGWPDWHPEAYCHRCGSQNLASWYTPGHWWTRVWAASDENEASYQGIVCPQCFAELAAQSGLTPTWVLVPDMATIAVCHSCEGLEHDATCHSCTGGKACPYRCECVCHCPEFKQPRAPRHPPEDKGRE